MLLILFFPVVVEYRPPASSLLAMALPSPAAHSHPSPAIAEIPVMARGNNQACTNIVHAKCYGNPGYSAVTGLPNCIIRPNKPQKHGGSVLLNIKTNIRQYMINLRFMNQPRIAGDRMLGRVEG